MAAEIEHPNVIPVYGVGEDQGLLFIVMRYVPGGVDLGQLMRSGEPFDPARVVRIVSQVAGALDVAHQRGLVHRDVKPGNILIAAHDQVYLTDFGLTKRVSDSQGMTQTGTFVGTVDYIAPEQVEGKPLDGRADQYALGCVAYQLLSGQVPFPRDSDVAKIFAHVNDPTPRLQNTPAALADAIQQAMAKDPNQRYRTTGELARALEHAIHGRPPPAPPTLTQQPPPTPTPKQNKRLPLILALIGALLLAGLATGLAIALTGTTHTPNKPTPSPTPTTQLTPTTASTGTNDSTVMPGGIPNSTSLSAPEVRRFLIQELSRQKSIPAKDDGPIVDCVVSKLESQGYHTVGDAGQHNSTVKSDAQACTLQLLRGG